ncbi:MAG: NAD(P)/FAD-dependent oxidoreductase [Methanobacteriota archaeon]|nr:MAG: NAD(P)/FAD-dependent oxidoreductase [Euryarchaeota archaeon]
MKVVVIGNNAAGTTAAKGIRDADVEAEIHVFTDEIVPYYARPRLIDYIAGTVDDSGLLFYQMDWYEKNGIALHLDSKVEQIDAAGKRVFAYGEWHSYDKLVLATGSRAFLPPFEGLPKDNVFTLRTLEDARDIKEAAKEASKAVVIGGGLLGLETARALAAGYPDIRVTILEYAEHLLMRQLDHQGAEILQDLIRGMGTEVITKAETQELVGDGTASAVRLRDGRALECDMVVVSAGARADLTLAKAAGIQTNRGIVVDSSLLTSAEDVYAIGDVAEFEGRMWGMIPPALDMARAVVKKVLGIESPSYQGTIPSNTLKVVGVDLTSIGTVRSEHELEDAGFEEIRAISEDRAVYKKFVIKDDRMIGAILLGSKQEAAKVTKMIKDGASVAGIKDRLGDPGYDFD